MDLHRVGYHLLGNGVPIREADPFGWTSCGYANLAAPKDHHS